MTIFFSATTIGFYNDALKESYIAAGAWPDDVMEISERWYLYLLAGQTKGKIISVNEYGQPILVNKPEPSKEQLIADADSKKSILMSEATSKINPLEDAVELGMATKDEVNRLASWKQYRVFLNRIDPNTAPAIDWPEIPN